ncbi:MAG: UDP-glucose/GDP-mannose dehydrogenase family protein [Alphaproteobacteria bacterium]|nr:UDP-glucose/GDP-mannose dehydrogenase family protein [Alphaproteobacteria bacterium]
MRIVMLGTGYVGLVSGACFAEFGMEVVCVDKDAGKIARLQNGEIPIYEPGLDELVRKNSQRQTLSFTTDLAAAMQGAEAVFIAVGTPSRRGDGHADLTYVYEAAKDIAAHINEYTVVVTKSTVPVGTGREVERIISNLVPRDLFDVASNPEFLREGSAIGDFMRPDRVVIGAHSQRAEAILKSIYRPLYLIETPVVMCDLETAELAKYAANAFLATKITFINEIADLCEKTGADVQGVARAIGLDGRIGRKFLHAGPGFGGSCFPKDTLALMRTGQEKHSPLRIVETVVDVNAKRKKQMAARVIAACGGDVKGTTIAVLGVTFKPNTDDMRDAPSLDILPLLQQAGAQLRAYDPAGMKEAAAMLPDIEWCKDAYDALQGSDAAVLITEWNEFRGLEPEKIASLLRRKILVDLRNVYKPEDMRDAGLHYTRIGESMFKSAPQNNAGNALAAIRHLDLLEDDADAFEPATSKTA